MEDRVKSIENAMKSLSCLLFPKIGELFLQKFKILTSYICGYSLITAA